MMTSHLALKIYSEPAVEPVSLQDLKEHLRLDAGSFADNLTTYQQITPGSHTFANNWTTYVGAGIDVLGYSAVVTVDSGTNGATGTVDIKIQECDTLAGTYTDWATGSFTQITTANDNAVYEKAYTGTKQYIRVVAKVLLAACDFGIVINKYASDTTEDTILTAILASARKQVESWTRRALITQTWDMYLDKFPRSIYFNVPFGKLQSVTSLAYTDSDGTVMTMTVTTEYLVDTYSEPGRIVLPYSVSWPSFTAYPSNPIALRFVCGYGATASTVPPGICTAIKMLVSDMYENRSSTNTQAQGNITDNRTVERLIQPFRLWTEF